MTTYFFEIPENRKVVWLEDIFGNRWPYREMIIQTERHDEIQITYKLIPLGLLKTKNT